MTKLETAKILAILTATYPTFYKDMKDEEMDGVIEIWTEMFKDCDYRLVSLAVKELINSYEYPPTIATIKNKIYELTNTNDTSPTELWDKLLKAIRNGTYGYEEEFEKLPREVQEFVREPFQLHELASIDSNTIHTVVKGQFLKQIATIKQRQKEINMMLPETRKMILGSTEKLLGD